MGLGSSRPARRSSRPPGIRLRKSRLAAFICGGSDSHAPDEIEDKPLEISGVANCSSLESTLIFSSQNTSNSTSQVSSSILNESSENDIRAPEMSDITKFSESKQLVPSQSNTGEVIADSSWERRNDPGSTSKEVQPLEPVEEIGDSSTENHSSESMVSTDSSDTNSVPSLSPNWHLRGSDESDREVSSVSPVAIRHHGNGNVLHVDVVSISSNILASGSSTEITSQEARRNSRRLFWDAFSRRSSRRHGGSTSVVFSTDDTDDLVGSRDRWLLDLGGDILNNGLRDDSGHLSRGQGPLERRWNARSQFWERLRGSLDDGRGRNAVCASGLHPDGTCSCQAFLMSEQSGTRTSISRIVLLAEALFEVLDEIHRQPMSLSLSVVSVPATEAVVNSFPLKIYKRTIAAESGDDVEQCYICLVEYDEEDKIRVLPCCHEFHMSCIDKWLKEIHGVCPLCRRNVSEAAAEISA